MICLQIVIHGKVYKTGMRYFLKQKASQLKVTGHVNYQIDHSLMVIASTKKNELDEFLGFCKSGNNDSIIKEVIVKQIDLKNHLSFEVLDEV